MSSLPPFVISHLPPSIAPTDLQPLSSSSSLLPTYLHKLSNTTLLIKHETSAVKQLIGEATGLVHLGVNGEGLLPKVHGFGQNKEGTEGCMISVYFSFSSGSTRSPAVQKQLGSALAKMHTPPTASQLSSLPGPAFNLQYGFPVPTHCGVTEQDNTPTSSWLEFYRDHRLGDLVRRINDSEISTVWEEMKSKAVPLLIGEGTFSPPARPVPIHGDLWSGNVNTIKDEKAVCGHKPVIYDCSVYYGHNEVELGMTRMFGGFTKDFYEAYHRFHPRSEPHYEERQQLYELYHHLNHALMFGGGYKGGALRMMKSLNSWAASQAQGA